MCEGATAGAGRQAEHAAPHTLQVIVLVERILRRLGDVHGVQTHAGALQIKVTQILVLLVLLFLRLLGALLLEARPLLLHLKHIYVSHQTSSVLDKNLTIMGIRDTTGKFSQIGKTGDDHWASCWVYPFVQREGVDGCTHLLFEERPSEGDPLFELFALALVLRLGLHLDLALVRRQQLVLLLQTLLLLLRLRHLRLVQLYLHHNKNENFTIY